MLSSDLYSCWIRCKVGIRVRVGLMFASDLCLNTDLRSRQIHARLRFDRKFELCLANVRVSLVLQF